MVILSLIWSIVDTMENNDPYLYQLGLQTLLEGLVDKTPSMVYANFSLPNYQLRRL